MAEMKTIVLVEDDPVLNRNICDALTNEGFKVLPLFDGESASDQLKTSMFDAVVLDINLPGKDGYDVCREFRKQNTRTPVLMLTAFDELDDKVKGFSCGADDYLTKPFFMQELILRVNALIKRSLHPGVEKSEPSELIAGDLVIDLINKTVKRAGTNIVLTPREYQILVKLIGASGAPVSKRELIKEIWGAAIDANTNTIEVFINFLRKKIDKPFNRNSIRTKIGFGYYFMEE